MAARISVELSLVSEAVVEVVEVETADASSFRFGVLFCV
jgi:hypothetical protein